MLCMFAFIFFKTYTFFYVYLYCDYCTYGDYKQPMIEKFNDFDWLYIRAVKQIMINNLNVYIGY